MSSIPAGYLKIAHQLRRRHVKKCYSADIFSRWEAGDETIVDASWPEVAEWMTVNIMPIIKRSSWRTYTAAIRAVADEPTVDSIFARFKHLRSGSPRNANTSSKRKAGVSEADLVAIEEWVYSHGQVSGHGHNAIIWLKATIYTGLRPYEWSHASISSLGAGRLGLMVNTAKTGNRSTPVDSDSAGDIRTIPLDHLDADGLATVQAQLGLWERYVKSDDDYPHYHKACVNIFSRANRDLWPRRQDKINLYSGRHEFSNICFSSGMSPIDIAVLLGHDSVETGKNHYGKRTVGITFLGVPSPLPSDVNAWMKARKRRRDTASGGQKELITGEA